MKFFRQTSPLFWICLLLSATQAPAQNPRLWQPPTSSNLSSHFEPINGRPVWFVDGHPFTALGAETYWAKIVYPRYRETMGVYDYTYPAAETMHLNMLKIPIKWSQVEPVEGQYDFSYLDHVKALAEKHHLKIAFDWFGHYASLDGTLYSLNWPGEPAWVLDKQGWIMAPTWVIRDTRRFPRAVDGDGHVHDNAASYDGSEIVAVEARAFAAFMQHIRRTDSKTHTIIGIQIENEIAVFNGGGRHDRKYWRDHSEAANQNFIRNKFTDDLKFTAWDYSQHWLRPLTNAGAAADPLPFFMNFVGDTLQPGIIGGGPGEDLTTYLENIPALTFVGLNNYVGDTQNYSADQFRTTLNLYRTSRNPPAITETDSHNTSFTERSLFLALGEYGSPLFTPWSLIESYPVPDKPYVLEDGTLANGAFALSAAYDVMNRALPAISTFGGTKNSKVFLSNLPDKNFSQTESMGTTQITVSDTHDGQAIVLTPSDHELILIGYRCTVALQPLSAGASPHLQAEAGRWIDNRWIAQGNVAVTPSKTTGQPMEITLTDPQVVRVSW